MKITAQEEYGLRCLLQLAKAGQASLSISEIADREGLSRPYVAKLLALLRERSYIEATRGRAGGYRLAQPATEIRLGDLLESLSEPIFEEPSYCESHSGTDARGHCVHLGNCSLRALWTTLECWVRSSLNQFSVADLVHSESHTAGRLRQRLASGTAITLEEEVPRIRLGAVARS